MEEYINIPAPENTLTALSDAALSLKQLKIYDSLFTAFERRQELLARINVMEESPLFLAPESEGIYDAMLRGDENSQAWIDIIVPIIDEDGLSRLKQAFGFSEFGGYQLHGATRKGMFSFHYRKVAFYHRDSSGREHINNSDDQKSVARGQKILNQFYKDKPLDKSQKQKFASFIAHVHDHRRLVTEPPIIGWAIESLLQQRGVPYIVNNCIYGKKYRYDPNTKHIEDIGVAE